MAELLGRTNRAFPSIWLSLSLPYDGYGHDALVASALASGLPIDVTSQPGLWGGHLRATESVLSCISSAHYEQSSEESHASTLVQAHLIETLSCVGRDYFDFYFLRVRRGVEEFQISGALQALEMARQEGHIRFVGVCCDGPPLATLGMWQFHDAFDVLLVPRNHYDTDAYDTLAPMAKERRVGVVTSRPLNWGYGLPFVSFPNPAEEGLSAKRLAQAAIADLAQSHPVMVGVRSVEEVELAVAAPTSEPIPDLEARLNGYRQAFDLEEGWSQLRNSEHPAHVEAARRRERLA